MIDEHDVREMLQRRAGSIHAAPADTLQVVRRARRRLALNGAAVTVAAVAIAVATLTGIDAIRTAPVPADTPAPGVTREDGEVLRFTGLLPDGTLGSPGDLVAVDPRTGEERVLVEDLDHVYSARWSGDGRWLAYETDAREVTGTELWVAGGSQPPRVVASGGAFVGGDPRLDLHWEWSPTGAVLATIEHSETLKVIDVATGETTDLGPIVADLWGLAAAHPWAWSPDGTHLVFAASSGGEPEDSLYVVDARSGARSLLARLPGAGKVQWSPDGAHIAVATTGGGHVGRLYVLDADGSDVRLVADNSNSLGFAWSPDGTRLAFGEEETRIRIRIATMDGADIAEIGTIHRNNCLRTSWGFDMECLLTWSPDGTRVAFRSGDSGKVAVFDAAGAGEGEPLDELTFFGWDGGWYQAPVWRAT